MEKRAIEEFINDTREYHYRMSESNDYDINISVILKSGREILLNGDAKEYALTFYRDCDDLTIDSILWFDGVKNNRSTTHIISIEDISAIIDNSFK